VIWRARGIKRVSVATEPGRLGRQVKDIREGKQESEVYTSHFVEFI
jgi:hypothetical protein